MRSTRVVHIIGCHAEGEVGDVIVGGVPPPPGATLWEQSRWSRGTARLRSERAPGRRLPPREPPGAGETTPGGDGFIVMEPEDTPPMSGSNAVCVATVLLETGIIQLREPETTLTLEAPAGLVRVRARCRSGRVERVEITNVPSFADRLGAAVEVPGLGTLAVDIAYGGDSFVIADATALGFRIAPDEARDLATAGMRIVGAANEQLGFCHPENADWDHISFCQIAAPVEMVDGVATGRNVGRRAPGDRPEHRRAGLADGHAAALARSGGSLAGRLSAFGHLAAARLRNGAPAAAFVGAAEPAVIPKVPRWIMISCLPIPPAIR